MTSLTLLTAVVVGLVAGFIADKSVAKGYGLPTTIIAGLAGAVTVPFLAGLLGIAVDGTVLNAAVSAIGAFSFIMLMKLIHKPS